MRPLLAVLPLSLAACATSPGELLRDPVRAEWVILNPAADLPDCLVRAWDETFRFGAFNYGWRYQVTRRPEVAFEVQAYEEQYLTALYTAVQTGDAVRLSMRTVTLTRSAESIHRMAEAGIARCGTVRTVKPYA